MDDDPAWLCNRLSRVTGEGGLLKLRRHAPYMQPEPLPRFAEALLTKTAGRCPDARLALVVAVLSDTTPSLLERVAPDVAQAVALQLTISLSEDMAKYPVDYRKATQKRWAFSSAHQRALRKAAVTCNQLVPAIEAHLSREAGQGRNPPGLQESLDRIRVFNGGEFRH